MKTRIFLLSVMCATLLSACGERGIEGHSQVGDAMSKSAKRGVAFSFTNAEDLPLLSPYISWDYNWGNTPSDVAALWFDTNDMDYCPMCWNGNYSADKIRAYVAAHPKTKYLLAFNEPNLTDQARMTPSEAAALWQPVVALAKELNLKLVSPAMNYGTLAGYNDPIKWLDEFFEQPGVSLNDIAAISIHCYMASASAAKSFIERFEKYNKPIWLTEFCAWDPVPGSVETQLSYMCMMLNYLEQNDKVERYAWFIPRTSGKVDSAPYMQLLTHTDPPELTDAGVIYTRFSSFDKRTYLNVDRLIFAGEYVGLSDNSIQVRPCSDAVAVEKAKKEGLMVMNWQEGQELTYQLYLSADTKEIALRYCGYSNSVCEVIVDGVSQNYIDMPRNGSSTEWVEATAPFSAKAGKHTVTLKLFSGSCYFSGLTIK